MDLKVKEDILLLERNTQRERKEGDLKEFWHFGQYINENDKEFF